MKKTYASIIAMACLAMGKLSAQQLHDSLLLQVQGNSSIASNGPQSYSPTSTGITYTSDNMGNASQALQFNGTSSYVNYYTEGTKFQHSLPVTVAMWVKFDNVTGNFPVFVSSDISTAYSGFWLQLTNGKISINVGDGVNKGTGNRYSKTAATTIVAGTWYHVAGVINSATNLDIYINGVKDVAATTSGTGTTMGWSNSQARIGYSVLINSFMQGAVDNLMVWGRALSANEILRVKDVIMLADLGTTKKEYGPFNLSLTANGTSSTKDRFGVDGNALKFNGTSDAIALPNNSSYKITFPFTVSAWVLCDKDATQLPIFNMSDHSTSAYYGAVLAIENGYATAHTFNGGGNGEANRKTVVSNTKLQLNQWHFVSAIYQSATSIALFVDGSNTATTSSGSGNSMAHNSNASGYIGFITTSSSPRNFSGSIDMVSVVKAAYTIPELNAMYTTGMYITKNPNDTTVDFNTTGYLRCDAVGTGSSTYQWQKFNGSWSNLSGATSKVLTIASVQHSDSGLYRCVVTSNAVIKNTNQARLNVKETVNKTAHFNTSKITIFPIPASDVLQIKSLNSEITKFEIYNVLGEKLIERAVAKSNDCKTDISNLTAGNYFIKIYTQNNITDLKFNVIR